MNISVVQTSIPLGVAQRRRKRLSSSKLYLLFAAVLGLPMAINFFRLSSSVSLGTAFAGLLLIGLHLTRGVARRTIGATTLLLAVVCVFVVLHLFFAAQIWPVDLMRGLSSISLLLICIAGGVALANLVLHTQPAQITVVVHRLTQILLCLGIWGGIGLPEPQSWGWNKPIFPFAEPSHLAITIAPYLIFSCVTSRPTIRFFYIAAALLMTVLLESATLAVIDLVMITISFRMRYALALILLVVSVGATQDLSYYMSRMDFSSGNANLSGLVFMQGWQLMGESLVISNGFGIGFQQLGIVNIDVNATQQISEVLGDPSAELNLFDGGFSLSKIISEFGVFGGAICLIMFRKIISAANQLHGQAIGEKNIPPLIIMSYSFLLGFFPELMLRGLGYFTPNSLLVVSSVWIIWEQRRRKELKIWN